MNRTERDKKLKGLREQRKRINTEILEVAKEFEESESRNLYNRIK